MSYRLIRYLHGINAELRTRTLPALADGTPKKLISMTASILTRLISESTTRPLLDVEFMACLRSALTPLVTTGTAADIRKIARELTLLADTAQWDPLQRRLGPALAAFLSSPSESARQVAHDILALEFKRSDQLESAYHVEVAAATLPRLSGHEVLEPHDLAEITNFLRQVCPKDPGVHIVATELVAGGFSKQTAFLQLSDTVTLPEVIVMRRDRSNSALATTVTAEFQLLKILHEAGVAVARPLALFDGTASGRQSFMLTTRAEGGNIGDYWDVAEPSRAFGLDLARQLARLHKLPLEILGDQLDGAKTATRDHVSAEIESSYADWRAMDLVSPVTEAAYAWLRAHIDLADGQRSLVHRDIGCHNMIVKDGRITAILDWEIAWIGNPARDVAYVRDMVSQCISWDEFLAAYAAEGVHVPEEGQLRFYSIWSEVRNLVWTALGGSIFYSGASDDLTLAYSDSYNFPRLCHRLARKLAHLN
jgi:aminoglycoside phosphotransferase (APT) family kinase protein